MCIQKNKEFPGLCQGKPARKCDRNFVDPSRNMKTWYVSQENIEM